VARGAPIFPVVLGYRDLCRYLEDPPLRRYRLEVLEERL